MFLPYIMGMNIKPLKIDEIWQMSKDIRDGKYEPEVSIQRELSETLRILDVKER